MKRDIKLFTSKHNAKYLVYANTMKSEEVEKLEKKLENLVEYREYIFSDNDAQLKEWSKNNKINKSNPMVGKYWVINDVLQHSKEKQITAPRAIEILKIYGNLIFKKKETLF